LEKLRDYRIQETPLDALTDRQQEVLQVAYDLGYYDVPRRSSTAEIASELDVDDSTVAEHLQRAERNLLKTLLG
jgi:predicted DNA binding protein